MNQHFVNILIGTNVQIIIQIKFSVTPYNTHSILMIFVPRDQLALLSWTTAWPVLVVFQFAYDSLIKRYFDLITFLDPGGFLLSRLKLCNFFLEC